MKSLNNFASLEITSTEEVKGGTFGCFSLFSLCAPKPVVCTPPPAPCYTKPTSSSHTGRCSSTPKTCTSKLSPISSITSTSSMTTI